VEPIQERDVNKAPQVTRPISIGGEVNWPVLSDPTLVQVVANDPEDEKLTFVWNIPRANSEPDILVWQTEAGDWISTVKIPAAWLHDGDRFDVSISDQATPRNVVLVQWRVEVVQ
jgi:hypothetical protein